MMIIFWECSDEVIKEKWQPDGEKKGWYKEEVQADTGQEKSAQMSASVRWSPPNTPQQLSFITWISCWPQLKVNQVMMHSNMPMVCISVSVMSQQPQPWTQVVNVTVVTVPCRDVLVFCQAACVVCVSSWSHFTLWLKRWENHPEDSPHSFHWDSCKESQKVNFKATSKITQEMPDIQGFEPWIDKELHRNMTDSEVEN